MTCLTKENVEAFTWMYFGYCIMWAQPSSLPEAQKILKNKLKINLCWKSNTGRSAAFKAKSFVFILVTSCHFTPSSVWEVSVIPANNRAQTLPWRKPTCYHTGEFHIAVLWDCLWLQGGLERWLYVLSQLSHDTAQRAPERNCWSIRKSASCFK